MRKKIVSSLIMIMIIINIFGYRVQATPQIDKSAAKSKIMDNYEKNKEKKNFKKDEIIVKVKTGTKNSAIQSVEKKYSIKSKKQLDQKLDIVKFDNNKYSMNEMLLNLNNDLNIEYAEPNYISKISSSPENEPDFSKMWGLYNTISKGIDINASAAWKISTGNSNIVVGIIDSGIDYNHKDLKDNIWINNKEIPNNRIDDDKNGYVDDYNGWNFAYGDNDSYDDDSHGTHVSGTIAASSNGIGIVGVAPTVKIMPLKAADYKGDLYNSDIISAIQYGTRKGVKIFNCSFGTENFSQAEYDVIKSSNALFMCAAGNGDVYKNGLNNDGNVKFYPASFDLSNIISVGSIDKNGYLSTFSNYGAVSVDIAAPGSDIYSTVPGGYSYKSGTSMATPHVTGVAALVLSANMDLSPIDIKNRILKNTHKLPQLKNKIATGASVDAFGAMTTAKPNMPTDVDDNGITDINDLTLVSLAYNSCAGNSEYKGTLDINNDSIVDIYDLVQVSKAIK